MDNVESTAAALASSMVVEDSGADAAEVLAQQLTEEPEAQQAEAQQDEGTAAEAGAQETAQGEEAAGDDGGAGEGDRLGEIKSGIRELHESAGWSIDMLSGFAADAQARADIAAGRSVAQAANAYAMRLLSGAGAPAARSGGKRGVQGIHRPAATETAASTSIEDMTDAQFEAFSRRAQELMKEGKKVRM